jgi:type II secretory pathway pseudopilin PulG
MKCISRRAARAFTLVEMLTATTIMLVITMIGGFVYTQSIKIYRENQGLMQVFQMAKVLDQQLQEWFSVAIPVPPNWIQPKLYNFEGVADVTRYNGQTAPPATAMDWAYHYGSSQDNNDFKLKYLYQRQEDTSGSEPRYWDDRFSGPHHGLSESPHYDGEKQNSSAPTTYFLPGFFGLPKGVAKDYDGAYLRKYNIEVSTWGYPRPDYRLKAHADQPQYESGWNDLTCWFYGEGHDFAAPLTSALDNPNIELCSLKFSRYLMDDTAAAEGRTGTKGWEETRLSFVRHQIQGYDKVTKDAIRDEATSGGMLRALEIYPLVLNGSALTPERSDIPQGPTSTGPTWIPRALDALYILRNPVTNQEYQFALRVHVRANPNPNLR